MSTEGNAARPVVLVVDGERYVRESVQKLLERSADVAAVSSPDDALKVLAERPVDVMLTDYRMGGTDGVQLLRRVRAEHPGATRLLMSGFLDQSSFTRFLSSGLVDAFITKPWEEARLREKIEHILGIRASLRRRELLDVVNGLQSLPTLPALFHDLVIAIEDRKSMKEIAALLERDPAVAARLIHVANSAFFGQREVSSLEDAAVLLGASLLKDLVLTTEIVQGESWSAEQRTALEGVFQHSFAVNRALAAVHRMVYHRPIEPAYCSVGIVHDLGKLLMIRSLPERYHAVKALSVEGRLDGFWRAEIDSGFEGSTHAEIGGWLLDYWNFPSAMVEVALFHHQPHRGHHDHGRVLAVTSLTNRLMHHAEGPGSGSPDEVPELGVTGLPRDTMVRLVHLAREQLDFVRKQTRL